MSEFGALAHSLADGDVSTVMSWQAIETWDTAQLCTVNWWCGSFLPPFCQNITLIHTFNCYLHQLFHYWINYYIICMTVIPRIFLYRILNLEFRSLFFFFCQSSPPTPSLNSFWCTHTHPCWAVTRTASLEAPRSLLCLEACHSYTIQEKQTYIFGMPGHRLG